MKKMLLFFTVFLFFGFLIAEDVQVYKDGSMILIGERWSEQESKAEPEPKKEPEPKQEPAEPAPEPEPEPEPEKEPEPEPEPGPEKAEEAEPETKEKTKFFYVQPVLGTEFGSMILFGAVVNLDIDFLVAETKRKNNIYLGVDLGAVFAPEHFWGIPLQANITFDFKQKDPRLNYVSLWMSLGANFWFEIWGDSSERYVAVAWRTGLSIVFVNNMVIKIGLDRIPREKDVHNLRGLYLSLMIALGYRF